MARKRSRRAFGALRKLPSGRWQASYTGPDLTRHNAPATFQTKGDAEAWLGLEEHLVSRHHNYGDAWVPPKARAQRAKGTTTLREYAPGVIERRHVRGEPLKPTTRRLYTWHLDHVILPALGDLPLRSITPDAVTAWYGGLDPKTPTRRAHAYSLLRTVMGQAVADGLIPSNPCQITGAGQTSRAREISPVAPEDVARLAAAMPDRLQALVLICGWCGLRWGEVAELRRRDVDLAAGTIRVERAVTRVDGKDIVGTPKSRAGVRTVHVPPVMLPALAAHLEQHVQPQPDALLFPRPGTNDHMLHKTFMTSYYAARESIGRPDLRLHDLRHSSAVLAAQAGATLAELMARLGHSTPTAALRYQHAAQGRDKWIADRMGGGMPGRS
ncbi:tyrosine-type recombinase/integrase [Arsenicicoccus dermatophilus]|uniref:tyrosine-type recombinase/integrase n=1 Tax=Arsenicicoccus dermatophilus TaxID=1076331 RepID=UPI001F4C854A|nr:site-specific integrase [Arsenicicoccus dermatophilus]MCH8612319.1 site-specific integrase [Arsenicicoccus dermatophilus]